MTITRKRAMTVVLGSGAAVLGAACPPASAASEHAPNARATVRHERPHARPRHRRPLPKPTLRNGNYVYTVIIGNTEATEGKPNMTCSGSSMRLTGIATYPDSSNASALWEKTPAAWTRLYTITTGPATTITVSWTPPEKRQAAAEEAAQHNGLVLNPRLWGQNDTAPVSIICGATSPGAVVGELGEALATWVLPAPVRSAAALMATPPTNINANEYGAAFEVLPNGTVPAFTPYS